MGQPRVAYLVSRFPKITETFILREMLELERQGLPVALLSLHKEREGVVHDEARAMARNAHYGWPPTWQLLTAQLFWLTRSPIRYARAWWRAIRGNARRPGFLARAIAIVPIAAQFAKVVDELRVQHIHAHWGTHPALAALLIQDLTGVPYSVTVHAHDLYLERSMLGEKLAAAAFVVTISDFNRRLISSLYGEDISHKTSVIRCGVDPTLYDPVNNGAVTTGPAAYRLLCVGSLEEYKGQRYLIEACALLKRRGIPVRCKMVGDGRDRRELEALVRERSLSEHVTFEGRQPSHRVRDFLRDTDVVVLPSIVARNGMMEGIPVALMEALAMQVPVVATSVSGVPELVETGRTGVLVGERDSKELADALANLYHLPERRRQLGERGRRKVLEEYDLRSNVRELRSMFLSRLAGGSKAY